MGVFVFVSQDDLVQTMGISSFLIINYLLYNSHMRIHTYSSSRLH